MFSWLDGIVSKIKNLSVSVDKYTKDTVIQSLPSVAYVNRAKKLIEDDKIDEAESVLTEALELPQKDALVYKYLGVAFEKKGELNKAIEAYKTSANLNSHDKEIWKKLGFALLNNDIPDQAEESFENANRISPQNTDIYTGWGMSLMKQQKFSEAHEKFVLASKINRYNSTSLLLSAIMEVKLGDYVNAEAKLSFLSNVNPSASSSFEYANLKFIKEDYNDAIFYAKKAIELNDKMIPAYLLLSKIYALNFDEENCMKYYTMAEETGSESINLYIEWGKSLLKFGNSSEAKIKFLKAYGIDSINPEARAGLGLCFAYEKNFEEASPLIDRCVKDAMMKEGLGLISCGCGDIRLGIDYFREALKIDEKAVMNYFHLAKCYEQLKNDSKVKDCYEQIINKNPRFAPGCIDYAKYLISKGKYAEAQRKLRKTAKILENNTDILNLLFYVNYILVKEKLCEYNIKEAVSLAEKILSLNPEAFEYVKEKDELAGMLKNLKESSKL